MIYDEMKLLCGMLSFFQHQGLSSAKFLQGLSPSCEISGGGAQAPQPDLAKTTNLGYYNYY